MPASASVPHDDFGREEFSWQLPAEGITIRIRWFGLCVGYVLVNLLGPVQNRVELNAILTLGAVYALLDTIWSLRGQVFLRAAPLFISLMEAVFIGVLCHFDRGLESPFRFYYFLSLLTCAIRYAPSITYITFVLHATSFGTLALSHGVDTSEELTALVMMVIFMGWVTWASTALVTLLKTASFKLSDLNTELQNNQAQLERRIAERTRELQESQALLVQQEKQAAFGLLAAGIAHEVGNPLAAISSLVQMMNRRELDDYMHEKLGLIDEQLRRIQRTLHELVDFSRPATNDVAICDIHEVLDNALNIAKYYKRKKGKTIVTSYADGLSRVEIVRDRILQVFLNLILNAMDATGEGGTIEIHTSQQDDVLRIAVCDDGVGIDPDYRARLFQPYFTTKATGTGLGLFVCRNILQESGGDIELTGTSSSGTTFTVSLPAFDAAPSEERTTATTSAHDG
ncbi:Sensor protein ZraS [Maioricimonas rarisocia]|uniref:histidine kinase n=1 Tax=Maioricimonas rarisocia TaxID=2528026 RepID=A0A517Z9G5_9PLAN|nr:ATP-binding protein [Maioricimonas rarisocia]QDU39126.1 Sensor protein ZraS [Maioricimonas rarisocia]